MPGVDVSVFIFFCLCPVLMFIFCFCIVKKKMLMPSVDVSFLFSVFLFWFRDEVVPFWHGQELFLATPTKWRAKPFWVDGAGHNNVEALLR